MQHGMNYFPFRCAEGNPYGNSSNQSGAPPQPGIQPGVLPGVQHPSMTQPRAQILVATVQPRVRFPSAAQPRAHLPPPAQPRGCLFSSLVPCAEARPADGTSSQPRRTIFIESQPQKSEPRTSAPQKSELRKSEPRESKPRKSEPQESEPRKSELRKSKQDVKQTQHADKVIGIF